MKTAENLDCSAFYLFHESYTFLVFSCDCFSLHFMSFLVSSSHKWCSLYNTRATQFTFLWRNDEIRNLLEHLWWLLLNEICEVCCQFLMSTALPQLNYTFLSRFYPQKFPSWVKWLFVMKLNFILQIHCSVWFTKHTNFVHDGPTKLSKYPSQKRPTK